MIRKVRARFANGVLTPLEPLDLEEGVEVVLELRTVPEKETEADKSKFQVIPNRSGLAPGVDPRELNEIIAQLEIEEFLEKERKLRERNQ